MWLCLVLLGNAPCLSVELSLKGLGVSCPGSPDGSCSCLRSLSCCLMLGPSLEDAFWRKSRRLASLAIVNTNWRKREKGSKKKKKTTSEGDTLKLEGGGRGSVLQIWVGGSLSPAPAFPTKMQHF